MNDLFIKVHKTLPIFKIDNNQLSILYTPGYSISLSKIPLNELVLFLENPNTINDLNIRNAILSIIKKAKDAINKWEQQKQFAFSPECLTIHAGSDCNLNCSYCYSKVEKTENKNLRGFPDLNAIETATRYIIKNKSNDLKRLTVVYHGSGEPTFHWNKLVESYKSISTIAKQHNLQTFNYIATNGCLSEDKINWLSKNMDLIGISCDGPEAIQQKQRTNKSIKCPPIEKVCNRIIKNGGNFDVRVTITQDTILKQLEITEFLIDKCKAKNIRIEPMYLASKNGFIEKDAEVFLENFLKAQKYAKKNGANLSYAGIRIEEQHGAYCDILRNTIRLTSDGLARNCFCFMNDKPELIFGKYDKTTSDFKLNLNINELKAKASRIPMECNSCLNIFHCSRGCPDYCIFDEEQNVKLNKFRCRLHQLLTVNKIKYLSEKHNE